MQILVVDDNRAVTTQMIAALDKMGHEITTAESPSEFVLIRNYYDGADFGLPPKNTWQKPRHKNNWKQRRRNKRSR